MVERADLLIAAAIDFNCDNSVLDRQPNILGALRLGKAGPIRFAALPGAFFAAREDRIDGDSGTKPREYRPVCGPDNTYLLLAGRIDDREEVIAKFDLGKCESDAQLYAELFAKFGDGCDARIYGDYAAIQWNPAERYVRLARSGAGFCPLHVWRDGSRMVIASIPRILFAAGLEPQIDDRKLGDALLLNYRDGGQSWYKHSTRVESGTYERHRIDGPTRKRFWSIKDLPSVRFGRDEDYVAAVDDQFRRATKAVMHGIAKPAVALSGGLDSQAVASYLIEVGGDGFRLPSFTSIPQSTWSDDGRPTSFGDEEPYVRALAKIHGQIDPRFITAERRRFGENLDAMHLLTSWPTRNETNMHWIHEVFAQAAEIGCDALFVGAAGNSTFSYDGMTGYPTWLRQVRWLRLARELRRSNDRRPLWRRAIALAAMPHLSTGFRRRIDLYRSNHPTPFTSWCPMREDFAYSSGALTRAEEQGYDPYFYSTASSREWRAQVLGDLLSEGGEITLGLRLQHGIAQRDPTLYQPFVELCAGIPDEQYLRNGEDRWLARRLLKGTVPEEVRREHRFGRQAADWSIRFARERDDLLAELEGMKQDGYLAARLDLERLTSDLRDWPGSDDPRSGYPEKVRNAVGRAVSTARFLRYVASRNVGS